ncbi:hypothetical protein CJF31_00007662 [Rutstroemia sp. NJR-2017a BVV2]|nr:hypothetical protein CJF31_00008728 [Rutstroemia sp. NJR-2017a BVV2]PQE21806.1 hypothetical protein CJF31_00007662 [Rutstroemia sp. NJR-2017a BVV2]
MPPTQHLLHALEILSVFLCAHHFWPQGITYSEKEAWERKPAHRHRARRSKSRSTRRRHPDDRRTRDGDRDGSRSRTGSVYAEEEVFVPRGIYRGDGSEFFPEMQEERERERYADRSGNRRGEGGGRGAGESDAGRSSGSGSRQGRNRKEREESGRRYRDYEERGDDEGYGYRNRGGLVRGKWMDRWGGGLRIEE